MVGDLKHLLEVTLRYALHMRLRPDEVATAQSLAWYYADRCEDPTVGASSFARVAVWHTLAGRDLPGAVTPPSDALRHSSQGAGMDEVTGREPEPVQLAIYRETEERIAKLPKKHRKVVRLRLKGWRTKDVAERLGLSPARISQILREAVERLQQDD